MTQKRMKAPFIAIDESMPDAEGQRVAASARLRSVERQWLPTSKAAP
jgi:hypothetical protein